MPGTLTLEIKAIKILQINTYTHAWSNYVHQQMSVSCVTIENTKIFRKYNDLKQMYTILQYLTMSELWYK